jgi:hypothetical protein
MSLNISHNTSLTRISRLEFHNLQMDFVMPFCSNESWNSITQPTKVFSKFAMNFILFFSKFAGVDWHLTKCWILKVRCSNNQFLVRLGMRWTKLRSRLAKCVWNSTTLSVTMLNLWIMFIRQLVRCQKKLAYELGKHRNTNTPLVKLIN